MEAVALLVDLKDVGKEWHIFTGSDALKRAQAVSEGYKKRGDFCSILVGRFQEPKS